MTEVEKRIYEQAAGAIFRCEAGIGVREIIRKAIDEMGIVISCWEQGSGAELRRLKEFLGDKLPKDWERQRFDLYIDGFYDKHYSRNWKEIVDLVRQEFGPGMEYAWSLGEFNHLVVMLSDGNQEVIANVSTDGIVRLYSFHKTVTRGKPC